METIEMCFITFPMTPNIIVSDFGTVILYFVTLEDKINILP